MIVTKSKKRQIQIQVENNQIDLGEKYAYAVEPGSRIEWTCEYPFTVQFNWDAPFKLVSRKKKSLTMGFKAGAYIKPIHPYKYTIAAFVKGRVITDDPFIIVIPPEQWVCGVEPLSVIIVKPPRG